MDHRIKTSEALRDNLAAAHTTVMLCRANIERVSLTRDERSDIAWQASQQIRELAGILAHLERAAQADMTAGPSDNVLEFPPR